MQLNYQKDDPARDHEVFDVDGTISDVIKHIASTYSIPEHSLAFTEDEVVFPSTEEIWRTHIDVWIVGLRCFARIDNPGVEPYDHEQKPQTYGYVYRKEDDKLQQNLMK